MGRRRKIRLAGCVVALMLLGAIALGPAAARARDLVLMYLYWVGCACLLLCLLGLALLDVLETVRIARKARIRMILDAVEPREKDDP